MWGSGLDLEVLSGPVPHSRLTDPVVGLEECRSASLQTGSCCCHWSFLVACRDRGSVVEWRRLSTFAPGLAFERDVVGVMDEMRSRMASAMLPSPITACQDSVGNCEAMTVERLALRGSMISRMFPDERIRFPTFPGTSL